jgi:hypothetical protein
MASYTVNEQPPGHLRSLFKRLQKIPVPELDTWQEIIDLDRGLGLDKVSKSALSLGHEIEFQRGVHMFLGRDTAEWHSNEPGSTPPRTVFAVRSLPGAPPRPLRVVTSD